MIDANKTELAKHLNLLSEKERLLEQADSRLKSLTHRQSLIPNPGQLNTCSSSNIGINSGSDLEQNPNLRQVPVDNSIEKPAKNHGTNYNANERLVNYIHINSPHENWPGNTVSQPNTVNRPEKNSNPDSNQEMTFFSKVGQGNTANSPISKFNKPVYFFGSKRLDW